MLKRLSYLLFVLFASLSAYAQTDSVAADPVTDGIRVSLLTCGTGDEIWEQFGHTAVRVTDSIRQTDLVYNYGTFSFGEGFEIQFMQGKLLYYVSNYPYPLFLQEYASYNRSVEEQELLLTPPQERAIQQFLEHNSQEEYKYYKYDFFFDNCATRIRDIFPNSLGKHFKFGKVLPEGSKMTFRDIMNHYFYRVHFERVGCNLLLGSRIDAVMTDKDIMFLPDYLRDGLAGATIKGKTVAADAQTVLPGPGRKPAGINWMLVITVVIGALTMTGLFVDRFERLGNIMSTLLLFITGLLGVLMLVMWLGTDHQGCENNYNILWALPTNVIFAFMPKRNKSKYAIVAIALIFVALLLHVFRVQVMPLVELWPLLLSLLAIYTVIIRKNRLQHGNN